jgi:hypothetical protein
VQARDGRRHSERRPRFECRYDVDLGYTDISGTYGLSKIRRIRDVESVVDCPDGPATPAGPFRGFHLHRTRCQTGTGLDYHENAHPSRDGAAKPRDSLSQPGCRMEWLSHVLGWNQMAR